MTTDTNGRLDALERAVKSQYRYIAVLIIMLLLSLIATATVGLRFSAYVKGHQPPAVATKAG
jgi:hypothetical protein